LKDFGFKKQKQLHLQKLSHLQRQFVRKCKNSKNQEKARIKLARFEEHIANCRKDWIEKETLRLVNSYQLIGLENLSIQGMMKGSKNAKNYLDISWSTFVSKLEQKSQFKNCQVVKVNRFFASSQICSCCGFKNPDVQKFHLQRWICPQCGNEHQRDKNAAVNIRTEAIRVLREAEENQEKSLETSLSKDTDSVLSVEKLANLALGLSPVIGNARNNPEHAKLFQNLPNL
jgi:putative transposase